MTKIKGFGSSFIVNIPRNHLNIHTCLTKWLLCQALCCRTEKR
uniref:Uncharacterized protein n=1 Tax=Anguilla anguilla TaxID=7936 RepID=A0A0E9QEB3_ANGAN